MRSRIAQKLFRIYIYFCGPCDLVKTVWELPANQTISRTQTIQKECGFQCADVDYHLYLENGRKKKLQRRQTASIMILRRTFFARNNPKSKRSDMFKNS